MTLKLILIIPDILSGDNATTSRIVELEEIDFQNKTIKQVVIQKAFNEVLEGQENETVKQALQLLFSMIQPVGIIDIKAWWNQSFDSLIEENSNEITIKMEFNEEGLKFIEEML